MESSPYGVNRSVADVSDTFGATFAFTATSLMTSSESLPPNIGAGLSPDVAAAYRARLMSMLAEDVATDTTEESEAPDISRPTAASISRARATVPLPVLRKALQRATVASGQHLRVVAPNPPAAALPSSYSDAQRTLRHNRFRSTTATTTASSSGPATPLMLQTACADRLCPRPRLASEAAEKTLAELCLGILPFTPIPPNSQPAFSVQTATLESMFPRVAPPTKLPPSQTLNGRRVLTSRGATPPKKKKSKQKTSTNNNKAAATTLPLLKHRYGGNPRRLAHNARRWKFDNDDKNKRKPVNNKMSPTTQPEDAVAPPTAEMVSSAPHPVEPLQPSAPLPPQPTIATTMTTTTEHSTPPPDVVRSEDISRPQHDEENM
eukprot:PhM_4_TR4802/c0_g2_i1/m.45998